MNINNNIIDTTKNTEEENLLLFFPTSKKKLVTLSLCTFGIYERYWIYKNWKIIEKHDKSGILPFWRAFFGILFFLQIGKYPVQFG